MNYFSPQNGSEGSNVYTQNQLQQSQIDQNQMSSDANINFETSVRGQSVHPEYLHGNINQAADNVSAKTSSTSQVQVL